jgi:hypothetical protein
MDNQIVALKEQFAAASEQQKALQAELKGVESALSDEQLQLQLAEFKTTCDVLQQKLESLKNPAPGAPPPISAEQMSLVEKSSTKYLTEWKKRKRICYDVLNKFSEQNGKKVRVIGEEIGIEFDEDVGAVLSPTPTVGASSKGPPSAMAGRVYPTVTNMKPSVPVKIPATVVKSAAVNTLPAAKAPTTAAAKPAAASKAPTKVAAPKAAVPSKKKAKSDSDSDSDSDSSANSSPKAAKSKSTAGGSKPVPPASKAKAGVKSTTSKPAASKSAKPVASGKKESKKKKKNGSDSESSFGSDDSESSDSDSSPMVTSAASKTPRAAAAKANASIAKKPKVDSDSDFEQ